ncbi:MAG: hypothetical protein CME65_02005 [Halobacteriovoraceae bacterium]|nr:hypothetical protein [Halobacteriovoraceae bacterium]|tara:strand:+ start:18381 stop:19487 length:1107 start_codon:yes stop_codon:yes gene_type:complete
MSTLNFTELKSSILKLHEQYERYLPATFFSGGFVLDVLTLGEVDEISNIFVLSLYLILAVVILSLEVLGVNSLKTDLKWLQKSFTYREDAFHFCLGALLSAFTLFYFKSSSLANSFFFLGFMVIILLLNEIPRFQKFGMVIRSVLIMLALESYLILIIPTALGQVSDLVFLLSITLSFCLSGLALWLLSKSLVETKLVLKNMFFPQIAVLALFILLYWTKVLPPVPLSIKSIGIYHNVIKKDSEYYVLTEKPVWKFWHNGDQEFLARPGDKVYVAASVFSPAGFSGKVFLRFMQESRDGWITSDRIPINILGGRLGGFRGYAYKSNYNPGNWQVRVETATGLEIGRINFEIKDDPATIEERTFRQIKF